MSITDETLVREALHGGADRLTAPIDRLAHEAATSGRRLRRRRRGAAAVASLAAVAVIGGVVAAGIGGGAMPSRDVPVAGDPSRPLPPPLPIGDNPGWWSMPATHMLRVVQDRIPPELGTANPVVVNDDRSPEEPEGVMRGWLAVDLVADGSPAGGLNVVLKSPEAVSGGGAAPGIGCGDIDYEADVVACRAIRDEAGAPVGRVVTSTMGLITVVDVTLRAPDGGEVYVSAANSADDKWGPDSVPAGTEVPLTAAQLRTLAADPAWTSWGGLG